MLGLEPFFTYYGGKWRDAPHYPAPKHSTIVEPFAGSAGYSLRYFWRGVVLVEIDPLIAEMWRYLIAVKPAEILAIEPVDHVDDLPSWVPTGARTLVGFNLNNGSAQPKRSLSKGLRDLREDGREFAGWSEAMARRVAQQVECIRHWRVYEGPYWTAPPFRATWFIDAPYFGPAGALYKFGSPLLDYGHLADFALSRDGQTIVCEAEGATWLPFEPHRATKAFAGKEPSREVVWSNEPIPRQLDLLG